MSNDVTPGHLFVENLSPFALHPLDRNPRKHSARQLRALRTSISTFGFVVPALIDQSNGIVAGFACVEAAKQLDLATIPCVRLNHLDQHQVGAFRIAHNRLAELSTWDDGILAHELKDLVELNLDFDLEATGFTMGEIDLLIEDVGDSSDSDARADTVPATAMPMVTRPGDIWLLRDHRIICGDATLALTYEQLIGTGDQPTMIFADPPYNVPIDGHVSGLGTIRHREFVMASGEMSPAEFRRFLEVLIANLVRISAPGSLHYLCMDWRNVATLVAAGEAYYETLENICVWAKLNAGMGSFYRSAHELIVVFKTRFKTRGGRHRNNVELGRHGRNRTNVWHYPGANSFGRATEEGNLAALHPTVKPVRLVADAILDCTARGEFVLDPFLGSGTTLIAAERTGRRCYGIELDPLYVDTTIRRWQAYSGEAAVHATTGRSFDATDPVDATQPRVGA